MGLSLDVHTMDGGVRAEEVAEAHRSDLEEQDAHGVRFLRTWVDESTGKVFCLVDAPTAASAEAFHRAAHGLVADEVDTVSELD